MIIESPALDFYGLLASIGGTLGLFGGLSFLSFFQFFEVFIYMLGCFRSCEPPFDGGKEDRKVAREEQEQEMAKSKKGPGVNSLYGSAKSYNIYPAPQVVED